MATSQLLAVGINMQC